MTTAFRRARGLAAIVLSLAALALPAAGRAEVAVSITIAPPILPVYVQPEIPGDGYIWTPGYWAYGPDGYFWVPGTWVMPPEVGFLWTPGWWGWGEGFYVWHAGYWGPHIGFYGGINYGFGYTGHGYEGGRWEGDRFYYNQTVNNISSTNIRNTYSRTVVNNVTVNNVSFNGGSGGVRAEPSREELAAGREMHQPPTSTQLEHVNAARSDRSQLASVNRGHPAIAASARPAEFSGHGVVAARGATMGPREASAQIAPNRGGEPGNAAPASRASESPQRFGQTRSSERAPPANAPAPRNAPTYRPAPSQREGQPPAQHAYQPPSQQRQYQPPAQQRQYQPPAQQRQYQPPAQPAYQPPPQPHYQQQRPAEPAARGAPPPQARPQGRPEPRGEEHPHR